MNVDLGKKRMIGWRYRDLQKSVTIKWGLKAIKPKFLVLLLLMFVTFSKGIQAQREMEYLNRGLVAVKADDNIFLSWRKFATDSNDISFNVYRNNLLVTAQPIVGKSNFIDSTGDLNSVYYIEAIHGPDSSEFSTPVKAWPEPYLTIPLKTPEGYFPNDCSVADLDGDGELEIIVKMERASADNAHSGYTDPVELHAYEFTSEFLWKINLGINIRAGAHYTQFMVYDLDGDGKAEVACKTAPGTKAGTGAYLIMGPAASDNDSADYRNSAGYVLDGPEYLTVFNGQTGAEIATVDYVPARGSVCNWGDCYGNRVDRFLACVAYLDGVTPSLVMCRGYYGRSTLAAWDFENGSLTQRWVFDSGSDPNLEQYNGQGAHSISVGDADNDGRDEIMYGAMAIDDDGSPMYNTNFLHGDATHFGDLIPSAPGLEFYMPSETAGWTHEYWGAPELGTVTNPGIHVRNAETGSVIIRKEASADVGRAMTADISAEHPGNEFWATAGLGVYNSSGEVISSSFPAVNFASWWDGDLLREMLDGVTISKWGTGNLLVADGSASNNGTKATPCLSGDILGDWREEVIFRSSDNQSLRLYTTTFPTEYGIYTVLHDPHYRLALTWQNVAYNQPPHPGFFIGHDMDEPPVPNIEIRDPYDHPGIKIVTPMEGYTHPLGLDLRIGFNVTGVPQNNFVFISDGDNVIDTIKNPPYLKIISNITTGSHVLSAKVKDKNGAWVYSDTISISVDEGHPYITMTSPFENPLLWHGDNITVSADAIDYDGNVDSVEFYLNGEIIASVKSSPFEYLLNNPDPNSYQVYGIVYDNLGKKTISDTVSFGVGSSYMVVQEEEMGFCGFTAAGTIDNNHVGFTGSGFSNSQNGTGAGINWGLVFLEPGNYRASWRYASASQRDAQLIINDSVTAAVPFKSTGGWATWDSVDVSFELKKKGYYDLSLIATQGQGLGNIDFLKIISLNANLSVESGDCSVDDKVKMGYPFIKINAPLSHQLYNTNDPVSVSLEAFDYDGSVDSVEIYLNGEISVILNAEPYTKNLSNPGTGMYSLHGIAYDNSGKSNISDTIVFNVSDLFITLQEEDGFCDSHSGSIEIESTNSGYTGSGYINPQNKINTDVTWAIEFLAAGTYSAYWQYASGVESSGSLRINDSPVAEIPFWETGGLNSWDITGANFEITEAGNTKVSIRSTQHTGLPNIDYLKIVNYSQSGHASIGDCEQLVGLSEKPFISENNILIYPSPVKDFVIVKLKNTNNKIESVSIYSLDGTQVLAKTIDDEGEVMINASNLSNGIYLVKTKTSKGFYTNKIFIYK